MKSAYSSGNLEAFVQVVHLKSFSAAARRRGQAPSAVSRQVRALEDELGVTLLLRNTRSLELTDAGQRLYHRAEELLDQLASAKREAAATAKQVRGRVRLTCWPTFGKRLILPSIPRLIEQFPGLSVDLDLSEMVHAPVLELTDLAIRVGRQQDTAMLQTKLGTQSSLVAASPGYVAKYGKPDNLDDCLQHRLIDKRHPAPFMGWRCLLRDNRQLDKARVLATDDLQAQADACVAGLGIAHIPNWVVTDKLRSGELIALLPVEKPITAVIYLLRASGIAPAPVRAFSRHLISHLQEALG